MRRCWEQMRLLLLLTALFKFTRAEPRGYYGNKYDNDGDDDEECNLVQRLGYKESYEIYSFPPETDGERCVWKFVAASGECTLQFRTKGFERGVNDCEGQTLSIGDEYKKRRICELGDPPRRFTSSGRKLLLSYHRYGKNEYGYVRSSKLSGVVRCVPKRRARARPHSDTDSYSNNSYVYNAPPMPTTASPPTTVPTTAAVTTTTGATTAAVLRATAG